MSREPRPSELRKAALSFANKIRKELGKPPVDHLYPGKRGRDLDCPITNTIYNDDADLRKQYLVTTRWGVTRVYPRGYLTEPSVRGKWNEATRKFVGGFDTGQFPDLEKPEE